ncbi:MAG: prepilin-type N-terminal cleavage/methylation domain-containing protein [Candidatus Riflebacteria bacterium]|nr:prepilin-type N-terminal cleavage/methylation domain-containing protein [Candidatus Riflebacteria bacterium]
MHKQGFTLIELLVVITILAILAGAAVPYVQNYLDDARISTAKSDLNEIRNAIMRFETDNSEFFNPGFGKTGADYKKALENFQQRLVGGYLMKPMTDPWGRIYYYSHAAAMVFSAADDGSLETNIISRDVRPLMAPTRAWWTDNNNNSMVDTGDIIDIKFARPIGGYDTSDINNNFIVTPTGKTTPRANPFGDGAVIEDFSGLSAGNRKHPRGNNWVRIKVCPNADMEVGDNIVASSTFYDTAEASIIGKYPAGMGLYEDDKIQPENYFPDNGTIIPNKSSDTSVKLKAAQ